MLESRSPSLMTKILKTFQGIQNSFSQERVGMENTSNYFSQGKEPNFILDDLSQLGTNFQKMGSTAFSFLPSKTKQRDPFPYLDGSGVPVFILESDAPSRASQSEPGDHILAVENVVNQIAPGSDVAFIKLPEKLVESPDDDEKSFSQSIEELQTAALKNVTTTLTKLRDGGYLAKGSVMNLSFEWDKVSQYNDFLKELTDKDEDGEFLYPNMRQVIWGKDTPEELKSVTPAQYQKLVDYMDRQFAKNQNNFNEALEAYQAITQDLANDGVTLVVAAGNQHSTHPENVKLQEDAEANFLSMSPYVISAGASTEDEKIANFSSRGRVTVAAPGKDVPIVGLDLKSFPDGTWSGTSASAPYVSSVIALMLQENPNLTFEEIKQILEQSAIDTAATKREEGAGIVDPEKAVSLAA